jgi:hypothetical protein
MEPTLRNPARERLVAGELALGVGIRQSRTVDIASIIGDLGFMTAAATERAKLLRDLA